MKLNVFKSKLFKSFQGIGSYTILCLGLLSLLTLHTKAEEANTPWDQTANHDRCQMHKANLINFQEQSFQLKTSSDANESLLDLLKERDQLTAELAVRQTLMKIWNDYQGFLSENREVAQGLGNPQGTEQLFRQLDTLQSFVKDNQQPVERYHAMSEVLNLFGRERLAQMASLENNEQKFAFAREQIIESCSRARNNTSLYMCSDDIAEQLQYGTNNTETNPNRGQLINQFVNTMVDLDDFDLFSLENFSNAFVDNDDINNPTGDFEFAKYFDTLIEKGKDNCRTQVLVGRDPVENCLSSEIPNLTAGEQNVMRRLEIITGKSNGEINNLAQVTQAYSEVALRTRGLHDESTRGTISQLAEIAGSVPNWQQQFESTDQMLADPGRLASYRERFKNVTAGHMLNLGAFLQHGELGHNEAIYRRYADASLANREGAELGGGANEDSAAMANRVLENIICKSNTTTCQFSGGVFKMENGRLSVDEESVVDIFFGPIQDALGNEESLRASLFGEGRENIRRQLRDVETKISTIKGQREYERLNAFKNYSWRKVREFCSTNPEDGYLRELTTRECYLDRSIRTGLNDFLEVGGELLAFSQREERRENLDRLAAYCTEIFEQDRELYNTQFKDTGVCPHIYEDEREENRRNIETTERTRRRERRRASVNDIIEWNEDGKAVDIYRPKSNLEIALPQVAYTFNEMLPLWAQRPSFQMQLDSAVRQGQYMKTQQAFYNAQYQSFLNTTTCHGGLLISCYSSATVLESAAPTFGNSAFNFSTPTTTPFQ